MNYNEVVSYLEALTIMPKTMPGLDKIRAAVVEKDWFHNLDPQKIITVAGTNGKGTTAAALQALLVHAGKKVGLYTSPHLVTTRERIRMNDLDIYEEDFVKIFLKNKDLIEKHQLSHFEALTLMAADYFFNQDIDYVIFEVGLGGTYDATNVFPNGMSIITQIDYDHENILGRDLVTIARNKFGIIKDDSVVIHHKLNPQLNLLVQDVQKLTQSNWTEADVFNIKYENEIWSGVNQKIQFETNLIGPRAIENIATAVKAFEKLGFSFEQHKAALKNIRWLGRMQKIMHSKINCPIYLSGDHNPQGIKSLIEILRYYKYQNLHLIVGIGVDKAGDEMLHALLELPNAKLYLTETPFKGRRLGDYPLFARSEAVMSSAEVQPIFAQIKTAPQDMVLVTGSLYLVGEVMKKLF